MSKIFTFIILLFSIDCTAQFNITGRVLNQADTKPVADASVFLSNATIGDKTANNGTFTLRGAKPGKYELVISIIGFETYSQTIIIDNSNISLPDITIFPKTIALKEVVIKLVSDTYREAYYNWFQDEFLGTSELAKDCKIINPEVLDFSYDEVSGTLTAESSDFLEIENDGLGYRIKYLLKNFTLNNKNKSFKEIHYEGSVLFTAMKGSPSQQRRWQQRRLEVYEGSVMHFLRSALNNRIEDEGFRVLQLAKYYNPERPPDSLIEAKVKLFKKLKSGGSNQRDSLSFWVKKSKIPKTQETLMHFPLNKVDIVSQTDQPGIFALGCDNDALYITYNKNHRFHLSNLLPILDDPRNTENTLITFDEPYAFFDRNGRVFNQNSTTFKGVWARGRVAELLPEDYETPQYKNIYRDTSISSNIVLRNTIKKLNAYPANQPETEKVYLHLDKPNYSFGDTIWYKAYTVIGEHHQLSALSGVLYVELISQKDSLITRQTLSLTSGVGWSDIPLPHALKQGNYRIRAYTNWMCNAGPDYFYNQRIRIGGMPVETNIQKQTIQVNPDVQFFPEGGELVTGVRSKVAFKAVNSKGVGEDIKGTIEDADGNVVTDFMTQHLGMGVFAFTPQSGKTYRAKISRTGEAALTVDLPKAKGEGYTLALNNSLADSIYIKVAVNEKGLNQQKDSVFYIIAQNNGKVYYTSQGKLEGLVYIAKVEKSRFPSGITQFTLFSKSGEPIAERIAFIQNNDTLKLTLTASSSTYATRQPVKLNLNAKDPDNNPIAGFFSIAIINDNLVGADEAAESTILDNFLLTADLKGYIEKPNYYFTNISDQTKADLDLLMLTQGYRRFEWKQILSNTPLPVTYGAEKSLELTGTVKTASGKPVPNGKLNLLAVKENLLIDTITDANGNFKFTGLDLADTTNLVLKARKTNNDDHVIISVKPTDYPRITAISNANTAASPLQAQAFALMQKKYTDYQLLQRQDYLKNGILLKQVNIHSNRPPKPPELIHSDNLNGPGHADQIIMGEMVEGCIAISECLEGKVLGLRFGPHDEEGHRTPYFTRIGARLGQNEGYAPPPLVIIVDGAIMMGGHLDEINASDIYSIEVLRSTAYLTIYGSNAPGGALVITTKRGYEDPQRVTPKPLYGLLAYQFTGYYKAKSFYTPKYTGPKTDAQQPDLRTTIYWNPNIITDKDGKASFEYFNNDTKGTYRVVVEGIDDNGNLGRQVFRYKVE